MMMPVVLVAALLGLADAAPAVFGAAEQEGFAAFVAAALAGPGSGTALGAYHAVHAASLRALSLPQAEARARLCASLAGGLAGDDGIESVAAVRPPPPPSVLAARRLTSAAARTCQALATLKRLQCPELADAALASETISVLMGNKVGPRRELILEESAKIESIEELDI